MRLPIQSTGFRQFSNALHEARGISTLQMQESINVNPVQLGLTRRLVGFGGLPVLFPFGQTKTCCGRIPGPLGRPVPICVTYKVPPFHTCDCTPDSFGPPVCRPWVFELG